MVAAMIAVLMAVAWWTTPPYHKPGMGLSSVILSNLSSQVLLWTSLVTDTETAQKLSLRSHNWGLKAKFQTVATWPESPIPEQRQEVKDTKLLPK